MKSLLKFILGLNGVSLIHLLRLSPKRVFRASQKAFTAASRTIDIPEIKLGEILGDRKADIHMTVTRYEDGMLPSDQAMVLLAVLVAESPREVLEIGTFMGHTSRLMAENLPTAIINTVDLPEDFSPESDPVTGIPKDDFHLIKERRVGREYKNEPCAERIRQHFGDTAKWDFSEAGSPTFFFIDGSHTYEYCKLDSEKCFAACGGRGVFLWHDCDSDHPGVVRFITEWRAMGRNIQRIAGTPIGYWKSE